MKAMPTLEGGLRIDAEDASDWELLRCVIGDAQGCEHDLASRLGAVIDEAAGGLDWNEYVVPDLREEFNDALAQVGAAIESAIVHAEGGPGPLWITPEDVFPWYSSFNQARLAIEEHFKFSSTLSIDLETLTPERQAALIRSEFYSDIQNLLLKYVMR